MSTGSGKFSWKAVGERNGTNTFLHRPHGTWHYNVPADFYRIRVASDANPKRIRRDSEENPPEIWCCLQTVFSSLAFCFNLYLYIYIYNIYIYREREREREDTKTINSDVAVRAAFTICTVRYVRYMRCLQHVCAGHAVFTICTACAVLTACTVLAARALWHLSTCVFLFHFLGN